MRAPRNPGRKARDRVGSVDPSSERNAASRDSSVAEYKVRSLTEHFGSIPVAGSVEHGTYDLVVSRAAAKVAFNGIFDLIFVWFWILLKQSRADH